MSEAVSDAVREAGMPELADKVILLTGAAGGMGRATATLCAERGARVVLVDINAEGVEETAATCGDPEALAIVADQSRSAEVDRAVAAAIERFGRIDALANIAGVFPFVRLEDTDDDTWDHVLRVNLTGAFYFCRAVVPHMRRQGGGSIVNVSSGAAVHGQEGLSHYSASKAGLIAMTKSLAREVAPTIRVNVVAPGPTATGTRPTGDPELLAELGARTANQFPILLRRSGTPRELAEVIAFLLGERSSFVTAQTFHANGGRFVV